MNPDVIVATGGKETSEYTSTTVDPENQFIPPNESQLGLCENKANRSQ